MTEVSEPSSVIIIPDGHKPSDLRLAHAIESDINKLLSLELTAQEFRERVYESVDKRGGIPNPPEIDRLVNEYERSLTEAD